MCPGSNSTKISISLLGPKSSRVTEPKKDSLRMWFRRQNALSSALGTLMASVPVMALLHFPYTRSAGGQRVITASR